MKFEGNTPLHDWIVENEVSIAGFYAVLFARKSGLGDVLAHAGIKVIGKEADGQYEKILGMVDAYQAFISS